MELKDYKLSLYESKSDTENKLIDLDNYIGAVMHGRNQDAVISGRKAKQKGDSELYKKIKNNSITVTPTGVFESGKSKNKENLQANGLVCIDIDTELTKEQEFALFNDPYTLVIHRSFGGDGFCVFLRINPDKINDAYDAVSKYYLDKYGIHTDQACKNSNRLRFLSFDPDLHVNNKAKIFNVKAEKQIAKPLTNYVYTESDFDNILSQIREKHIDLCQEDYYRYIRIGLAIASHFGESGRQHFHYICSFGSKYNEKHTERDYNGFVQNRNGSQVTIGTFYYYCKESGVEIYSEKTKQIINRVAISKTQGTPTVQSVVDNLNVLGIDTSESDHELIQSLIDSKTDYSKLANSDLTEIEQLANFIVDAFNPSIDEITHTKYVNGRRMEKRDVEDIYISCKKNFDFNVNKNDVKSILSSSYVKYTNILKDFVRDNSELKPSGYIDEYISFIHPQNDYNKWAFKKWIVGTMHNWFCDFEDRESSPLTLVLTGKKHGTGKCLAKDTPILMYDGTIKMVQDVIVGDLLMGDDGSYRRVLSLARGQEMMYRVDQNKAMSYTVNESHILSLKNRRNHKTVNISVREYMKLSDFKKHNLVGYRGQILNDFDSELPIPPRLLGLWLGDGTSNVIKNGFSIESMDSEIIDYIYEYAKETNHMVGINENKGSKSNCYRLIRNFGRGNGIKNDPFHIKTKMIKIGLGKNKFIPSEYKFSSRKQRLELLAGIIDSDGSKNSPCGYEVTQKSKEIINDIAFLVRSLGFRAVIKERKINDSVYYRMSISGNLQEVPVLLDRKRIDKKNCYTSLYSTKKVTPIGYGDYYGFEIDGNKLFMLGDFTVTHNTSFFRNIMPSEIQKYLIQSKLSIKDKDSIKRLATSLIILDDEFGGKAFKDDKEFKDISDQTMITMRLPYGEEDVTLRRRASLAGTSNELDILKDVTGNRRILPILVESTEYDKIVAFDKTSLIMEAYNLYKSGFEWRIYSEEEKQYIKENTNQNEVVLPMEEIFFMYFSKEQNGEHPIEVVMNQGEVWQYLNLHSGMKPTKYEIAEIFKKNNFDYKSHRIRDGFNHRVKNGVKLFMAGNDNNVNNIAF